MARTPNYSFERAEREREKAKKAAQKANDKREQRERARLQNGDAPAPESDDQ